MWAARRGRVEKQIDVVAINERVEGSSEDFEFEPEARKDQDRSVFGRERFDKGSMRPRRNVFLENELAVPWRARLWSQRRSLLQFSRVR